MKDKNRPHSRNGKPFHGGSGTRLFHVWVAMRERCRSPYNRKYPLYGGRGISVCDEWEDFSVFREWAMQHGYAPGLTIDRIDVNGNYTPENCRWATYQEQNRNNRRNRFLTFNGKTQCVQDWAKEIGLTPTGVFYRLNSGKPIEEVLSPIKKTKSKHTTRNER